MGQLVTVEIPIEAEAAPALADAQRRELVGRLVSRMLRPRMGEDPLAGALERLKTSAHAAGLTDEIVDAALAAHNAERRG
jgi:hypothetical protein